MTTARRLACLLLLVGVPALAQGPLEPSRLPPDTNFYIFWRGTAALGSARSTNTLLKMWSDPGSLRAREALVEALYSSAKKKQSSEPLNSEELGQLLSLVENPVVVGVTGSFLVPGVGRGGSGGGEAASQPTGSFVIYDATGKEEILRKLQEFLLSQAKDRPIITSYAFGPTTVEKVVWPNETYYRTRVGPYAIRAGQQALVEDLITRLRSPEKPAASLEGAADYQAAQKKIDAGATLVFFGRAPDLGKITFPTKEGFDAGAFVRALHLERLHAVVGSLSFSGEATRFRGAALGDTSPGSVFDLVGESSPAFATLTLAPAGLTSYSAGRVNLLGVYQVLRSALEAALPPKQRMNMELIEAVLANQIEMKIPVALELLRGEVASMTISNDFDPLSQLYAATIHKQPEVLKLLRTVLGRVISDEEQEGDTTYLKLSTPSPDPKHSQPPRVYYVAVTPQTLLVAPRRDLLKGATARSASKDAPAGSLAADAAFRRARARLPENLSSLGYADFTRIQWEKVIDGLREGIMKKANSSSSASLDRAADSLKKVLPDVLRRHLHGTINGMWKGRDGVHFDGYIE